MTEHSNSALILTLRLGGNYGGIMQAYALQQAVGAVVNGSVSTSYCTKSGVAGKIEYALDWPRETAKTLLGMFGVSRFFGAHGLAKFSIERAMHSFVRKNICTSRPGSTDSYGAVIVGSDQVWRAAYTHVPSYFLSGEVEHANQVRIAYAASFGTGNLDEWSDSVKQQCQRLIKKFDRISVREWQGIDLVTKELNSQAVWMPDPVFLLSSDDYSILAEEKVCPDSRVFVYLLDESKDKTDIAKRIVTWKGGEYSNFLPREPRNLFAFVRSPRKFKKQSVESWLRGIRDSQFVVTDSFHGAVFSIIFHTPFLVLGNPQRGSSRIEDLLKKFGLEDRVCTDITALSDFNSKEINWERVEKIRKEVKFQGYEFLRDCLSDLTKRE